MNVSKGDLPTAFRLKAKLKLYCTDPEHEDFDTVIQDVYLGTVPYMTDRGVFIINGAERVVVSQLHRSPGSLSSGRACMPMVPNSIRPVSFRSKDPGSSLLPTSIVMYAYIDRKKKLPVTTLLRAIGYESDKDVLEIFGLADEIKVSKDRTQEAGWPKTGRTRFEKLG
jgi:DNA-directed RNA polymerase subunit beta